MNDWEMTCVSRPVGGAGHNRGSSQCHKGMRQAPLQGCTLTVHPPHSPPQVQASVDLGATDPKLRCEAKAEVIQLLCSDSRRGQMY